MEINRERLYYKLSGVTAVFDRLLLREVEREFLVSARICPDGMVWGVFGFSIRPRGAWDSSKAPPRTLGAPFVDMVDIARMCTAVPESYPLARH